MPLASTAITIGGIQAWDEGSRVRGSRNDGYQGERKLRVAGSDAQDLVTFLLGGPTTDNGDGTFTAHPAQTFPGWTNLYFASFEIERDGKLLNDTTDPDNNIATYDYVVLTAVYESNNFGFDAQDLTLVDLDFGEEAFSPPIQALQFSAADGGGALPSAPAITVNVDTFTIQRRNLPSINPAIFTNASKNPLNSVAVPYFGITDPKKLKYGGARSTYRRATNGIFWDVSMRFIARDVEWDKVMDIDGKFKTVVIPQETGDPNPLLGSSDLNILLGLA